MLRMGSIEEGKEGKKELSKLESFIDKYNEGALDIDDIKNLSVHLSIGSIVCEGIAESEEQIEALKEQIAREK